MGKVTHHWWCALVLACRTPFLPKQSIVSRGSPGAPDSLQVFMTAADTVTGSAVKHTALGCAVKGSQGTKTLFPLASKQQKSSPCNSLFRLAACGHPGCRVSPKTQSRWSQWLLSQQDHVRGDTVKKPKLVSAQHRTFRHGFLNLPGLISPPELPRRLGWRGKQRVANTHELPLQTAAFKSPPGPGWNKFKALHWQLTSARNWCGSAVRVC